MIEIKNLHKYFGENQILKGINLKIEKGDFYGLIGASGAGKSTLLRTINGLESFDQGEIWVKGKNIKNLSEKELNQSRKDMGMIFQQFNLLKQKTVLKNVMFPLELKNSQPLKAKARALELLDYVGLKEKAQMYPSQLSGGEKQRVAIARALANQAEIILSDEATSALDPENTQIILDLLKSINRDFKITILMVSHEMQIIKETCNKVAILDQGQIIEDGTVQKIFTQPQTDIAKAFIGLKKDKLIKDPHFDGQILQLFFPQNQYAKPIVYRLIKDFDLELNIISGNINQLVNASVGYLILKVKGSKTNLEKALTFLDQEAIGWEMIT